MTTTAFHLALYLVTSKHHSSWLQVTNIALCLALWWHTRQSFVFFLLLFFLFLIWRHKPVILPLKLNVRTWPFQFQVPTCWWYTGHTKFGFDEFSISEGMGLAYIYWGFKFLTQTLWTCLELNLKVATQTFQKFGDGAQTFKVAPNLVKKNSHEAFSFPLS